jgi:tetratricopeptide (TPR) repeat protein
MDEMVKAQPKRMRELVEVYIRVLSGDPKRLDIHRKLIDIYLAYNSHSRAARQLDELMKQDPSLAQDPIVMEQYALCAQKLGQIPQAIERYQIAIDSGKASSDAYLRLANLLQTDAVGKDSLEKSRKLLDRLIAERPKDPAARLAYARYYLNLKKNADAIRELQTALSVNPEAAKSFELVTLLAELHRQNNDPAAARDVYAQAIAANPEQVRYRLRYADLLTLLGDQAKAEDQLREAIRRVPPNDELAVDVIDRMIALNDLSSARQEIERRFGDKSGGFADYLNGKLDYALGDWPSAQAKLTRALPNFEKMPLIRARTHEALGHCAQSANNPDRMAACFAAALQADPALASARLGLAEAHAILGRGREAADTFRQFAANSADARVMLVKLSLQEQLARPADRRNWSGFDEALGAPPYSAALANLRIVALRLQGRRDDAIAEAKSVIEKQPESLPAYVTLATLQGESDAKAALATLTAAESKVGDKIELRLAKANILAAEDKNNVAAIEALAGNTTNFTTDGRSALCIGLANVLARRLNKPAEAMPLLKKASEAKPNDLTARTALVDVLLALNRIEEVDAAIDEIRKIEGAEGPSYLFALVARSVQTLQSGDANRLPDLRAKIDRVLKARPTWGRAALLAAELDDAAGDGDAALDKFHRAFTLGERRPAAVQRLVSLLVARRRFDDARRVLDEAEQTVGLNDELRRTGSLLDAVGEKPGPKAEDLVKQTADSKLAADHLFRGQWFLLAHRPAEAVAAYEKALAIDATNPDGWLGLIHAHALSGNAQAGQAAWERARSALAASKLADPAAFPLLLGLGREALGDYAGAEQLYRDGLTAFVNHPALLAQLAMLYQRLGRVDDAAVQFRLLLNANASDSLKRLARRELALGMIAKGGLPQINASLELLAANAPPTPDDLRRQGLIMSFDPFRRAEARRLLEQAATLSAPSQDDALHLAEFYVKDDDLAKAEEVLRESTRGAVVPLALLHKVQRLLGKDADANQTFERIRSLNPASWEVAVEDARQMAARNEKADAAKKLQSHQLVKEPAQKLRVLAPTLEEIGCLAEAEELLKSLIGTTKLPGRQAALAYFYAHHGRGLDAIRAAAALPDSEYRPGAKARILYSLILPLPRAAVPALDQNAWDKLIDASVKWDAEALAIAPNDLALLTLQGVLADARGQTVEAVAAFEKVVALDPKAETAANSLAYLLLVGPTQNAARAESILTNLIASSGPKPSLLDTRALARLTLGQTKEAGSDVEAAIVQMPAKGVYWFRMAQVREKAGEFASRDQAFQKAMRLGLEKPTLHPLEWPAFEKMRSSMIQKQ